MQSFRFALEKVLAFRKRQWELESSTLAALMEHRRSFEERKSDEEARQHAAEEEFRLSERLSGREVAQHAMVTTSGRHSLRKLHLALAAIDQRVEQQRRACLQAKRNFELVAKLRAHRWQEWLREADREMERESTELYLAQRNRRSTPTSNSAEQTIHIESPNR